MKINENTKIRDILYYGQTVYVDNGNIIKTKIINVGFKYALLEDFPKLKFEIYDGKIISTKPPYNRLYKDRRELKGELEKRHKDRDIKFIYDQMRCKQVLKTLSYADVSKIRKIIENSDNYEEYNVNDVFNFN